MLTGKIVVITGAGRGIGLAMARRFGEAGAQVVIAEIDAERGAQAARTLQTAGIAASFAPLDVRDPAQSAALVAQVLNGHGRLDIWVNNAGVSTIAPAETVSRQQWDDLVAVNLSGLFFCAQAAAQPMLAQGRGVILNLASVTGMLHSSGRAAYSIVKAGVIALTEALGVEWASRGVRVVGIAPGVVETEMAQAVFDAGVTSRATYERRTPLRRLGTAEEIAETALFLVSDEAAYITAETVRVDGGWVAYQMF
jgi:3-oxoacyl-[acyl-carrier protein] reductase